MSDLDLEQLRQGHKRAWDAFVDRFAAVIHAAVRRTLRAHGRSGEDDVADVVQDVFVRLVRDGFRALRGYDPARAGLTTWLTVIARSAAIDHLRRRRPPTVPLEESDAVDAAAPASPAGEGDGPQWLVGCLDGRRELPEMLRRFDADGDGKLSAEEREAARKAVQERRDQAGKAARADSPRKAK